MNTWLVSLDENGYLTITSWIHDFWGHTESSNPFEIVSLKAFENHSLNSSKVEELGWNNK